MISKTWSMISSCLVVKMVLLLYNMSVDCPFRHIFSFGGITAIVRQLSLDVGMRC